VEKMHDFLYKHYITAQNKKKTRGVVRSEGFSATNVDGKRP